MTFYQVTARYMGTEKIAYAEGEDYSEVMRECAEGVNLDLYPFEYVTLKAIGNSAVFREVSTPMEVWIKFHNK